VGKGEGDEDEGMWCVLRGDIRGRERKGGGGMGGGVRNGGVWGGVWSSRFDKGRVGEHGERKTGKSVEEG